MAGNYRWEVHVRYIVWPILKYVFILVKFNKTGVVGYPRGSALTSPTTRVYP